jgi:hypothetical protein
LEVRDWQAFQTILGHFIKLTSSTEILSREYPEKIDDATFTREKLKAAGKKQS